MMLYGYKSTVGIALRTLKLSANIYRHNKCWCSLTEPTTQVSAKVCTVVAGETKKTFRIYSPSPPLVSSVPPPLSRLRRSTLFLPPPRLSQHRRRPPLLHLRRRCALSSAVAPPLLCLRTAPGVPQTLGTPPAHQPSTAWPDLLTGRPPARRSRLPPRHHRHEPPPVQAASVVVAVDASEPRRRRHARSMFSSRFAVSA